MAQLRQDFLEFEKRNTRIVVIGPEDTAAFRAYFGRNCLPFTGLPDPAARVLKLYGQEVNLFKLGRMPSQLIIDTQGIVRYVHYGHSMADIPENQQILEILDNLSIQEGALA